MDQQKPAFGCSQPSVSEDAMVPAQASGQVALIEDFERLALVVPDATAQNGPTRPVNPLLSLDDVRKALSNTPFGVCTVRQDDESDADFLDAFEKHIKQQEVDYSNETPEETYARLEALNETLPHGIGRYEVLPEVAAKITENKKKNQPAPVVDPSRNDNDLLFDDTTNYEQELIKVPAVAALCRQCDKIASTIDCKACGAFVLCYDCFQERIPALCPKCTQPMVYSPLGTTGLKPIYQFSAIEL